MALHAPRARTLTTRALAKVNLTLEVLGRRADGYHDLASLVVFAGVGDELALAPGPALGLSVRGPFADGLDPGPDNLILRAQRALAARVPELKTGHFTLTKRLPIASGIGGGSADAAAALRLLARLNALPLTAPAVIEAARETGADVPVCLASRARMMAGVGERLGPVLSLPPLFAVLVNPGVAVATAAVFAALGLQPGASNPGRMGRDTTSAEAAPVNVTQALATGNDLEAPARRLAPAIGDALAALAASKGCQLARMSGSGATCFGLFADCRQSAAAARSLARAKPGWWVKPTVLR
jgi:4-diphosphocytidyl-2-C-methyl-D-erythritol kinase